MKSSKIITISLGGSIVNPGSIDREFLIKFRDLILNHIKETKDKFVIICGGGNYIAAAPGGKM